MSKEAAEAEAHAPPRGEIAVGQLGTMARRIRRAARLLRSALRSARSVLDLARGVPPRTLRGEPMMESAVALEASSPSATVVPIIGRALAHKRMAVSSARAAVELRTESQFGESTRAASPATPDAPSAARDALRAARDEAPGRTDCEFCLIGDGQAANGACHGVQQRQRGTGVAASEASRRGSIE